MRFGERNTLRSNATAETELGGSVKEKAGERPLKKRKMKWGRPEVGFVIIMRYY
jgi:hypothetical protein